MYMENQRRLKIMDGQLNDLRKSIDELTNEFYKFKMKPVFENILVFAQLKEGSVDQ